MRRFISRRPSPAMAIAFVALLAALSGTAVALPGTNTVNSGDIVNNSVRSKDVKNNNLRGKDVRNGSLSGRDVKNGSLGGGDVRNNSLTGADINESTLGTVPNANHANTANSANSANHANTASSANSANTVNTLRTIGVRVLSEGESATLASYGPFTLTARCDAEGVNTAPNVFISSSENHWAAGTYWNGGDGDLAAGADYSIFEDYVTDAPGGDPSMYEGYYYGATAFTPSGRAIDVYVGDWANADTNNCAFWGHVVIDS